jgi:hypothetical protein
LPGNIYEILEGAETGAKTPAPPKNAITVRSSNTEPLEPRAAEERFCDNGDNTVTDCKHRLMWIKNPGMLGDPIGEYRVPCEVDWLTAKSACEELRHSGFEDWRLPTIPEWEKLCDDLSDFNPEHYLEDCCNNWYWTSSESKRKGKCGQYYAAVNGFNEFKTSGPWETGTEWHMRPVRTAL